MRSLLSALLVTELVVGLSYLFLPLNVQAENADPPWRLRFSLVHDAVPRYYEMFGILEDREQPLPGSYLLPAIEPPAALSLDSSEERDLFPQYVLPGSEAVRPSEKRPVKYSLNDRWTAQLSYQHSVLAKNLSSGELRTKKLTEFSTDRERDVLGLQMDWRLAGSTVGVGYRFQSMRGDPGSGVSGIGERFMHSFTLGFTKEWGGAKASEP